MRLLCLVLVALIALVLHTVWWGKGGWLDRSDMLAMVRQETANNEALTARNNALRAELEDLRSGHTAIEERARGELNMIAPQEIFVQFYGAQKTAQ